MKPNLMRFLRASLLALIMFGAAYGRYDNATQIETAIQSYTQKLVHENDGIVGTSVFLIMQLKAEHPESDFSAAQLALDTLALHGETPEIRYMAFLANTYLSRPQWLAWMEDLLLLDYESGLKAFRKLVASQVRALKMGLAAAGNSEVESSLRPDQQSKIEYINSIK